jgi:chromosome segregation ATPase
MSHGIDMNGNENDARKEQVLGEWGDRHARVLDLIVDLVRSRETYRDELHKQNCEYARVDEQVCELQRDLRLEAHTRMRLEQEAERLSQENHNLMLKAKAVDLLEQQKRELVEEYTRERNEWNKLMHAADQEIERLRKEIGVMARAKARAAQAQRKGRAR